EMVEDVEVERRAGDVEAVRRAVGLDLVRLPAHQLRRALQVGDRAVELPDRDPPVPAVAVEPGVFRMLLDPLGEGLDRLAVAAEVGQATPEPDDRVRIAWRGRVGGARRFKIALEPRP